jgi:hypothetical protein
MPDPDPTPDPVKAPDPQSDPKPDTDPPKDDPKPDDLGPNGKAALDAERKARRDAEKAAREAQKKLDDIEAANLTKEQAAEKRATDAEAKVTAATEKLRKANLITALSDEGITGGKAKAAARLLDAVEYDDNDEPTNLADAITAAKAEYGEDMFKGATPAPPPDPPDHHHGPRPPVTPDEDAALAAIFPQLRSRDELKT